MPEFASAPKRPRLTTGDGRARAEAVVEGIAVKVTARRDAWRQRLQMSL